jgi:hypothetical protein
MVDLSRYRGIAIVGAGLVVAFCLVDISLTAMLGFVGEWLPYGEHPSPDDSFARTGELLTGVALSPQKVGIGTEVTLGVLLGQSTLGAAVDTKVLAEHDGAPIHWLNLHGWGASVNGIHDVYDLVPISGLRPNVVVIAMNPFMLVGIPLRDKHPYFIKKEGKKLKPWSWIWNNRTLVNEGLRINVHYLKIELCRAFGYGLSALYPAYPDPWHRPFNKRREVPESAKERAESLEYSEHVGWFDASRYAPGSSNSRALIDIIQVARCAGSKVCIILLPEHSELRKRIPPEAVGCLAEINRLDFAADPVPVYDLRERLNDDQFSDVLHVHSRSMEPFSVMIADCVRDWLSGHPSLGNDSSPLR